MSTQLIIDKLCKSYKRAEKMALNELSLSFPPDTVCGLLGKNGAGKTTLIKCIVGLLTPDSGHIYFDGTEITNNHTKRLQKLSVVLDGGRNLINYMTVAENIRYFNLLRNRGKAACRLDEEIVRKLDLEDIFNRQIQTLSFGMRQRASIAVALSLGAEYIIMDEPTTGLDVDFQRDLSELVRWLKTQYGCSFIISSHDMDFVGATCDYCILIDEGRLVKSGSTESLKTSFDVTEYTIIPHQAVSEAHKEMIKARFPYIRVEDNKLRVFWDRNDDFVDLMMSLHALGIQVASVEQENSLAAVINRLSNESM